ncbi:MAG: amino acid adenylation domain-containing protein [Legionella longbeachae]|nr:amino acid adenylation domain-containing protein [Legionella longbeachae]
MSSNNIKIIEKTGADLKKESYLTPEKYSKKVYDYKAVESMSYEFKTLCQLFEEQVARSPNHIAIEYKDVVLSFSELNELSNQLARYIRRQYKSVTQKELKPDTLIPISVGRSADFIIGILGILKAGGAYVPVNPDYPVNRIQHILTDINSKLILTESHLSEQFKKNHTALQQILLDERLFLKEDPSNLYIHLSPTDLAYVIYTSGSSGTPKGVLAQHANVISQVVCANYFCADESDTMAFFSDVSFDSTTFELWGSLLNGARLFIPDNFFELLSNPTLFKETIDKKNLSILLITRALFDLLYTLDETVFAPLKFLLVGGEALTKNIMLNLLNSEYKPKNLINAYGPTENSTFCTTYVLHDDFSLLNSVPIGRPYSNRIGVVVDKYLQLLPIGAIGELYVGGPSLSRGYLNNSELTQERFIANPFFNQSGARYPRIYKTNDLVKWLPDGNLEYAGRNDFQVKLRGYRIELAEIETKVLEFPGIKHSVVLLHKNDSLSYLVAYYVADNKFDDNLIRKHLASILPDYMIPSIFIYLDTLPVTTNGKLDRKALPTPEFQLENTNSSQAKSVSIEQTISSIWSRILNLNHFGKDASFFNLGGNSLAAMMVRKELEDAFAITLNIVELFQHTTLTQLSERVSALIATSKKNSNQMEEQKIEQQTTAEFQFNEPIAIVGMACRIPGAKDPESFWELLINEGTNLRQLSAEELRANSINESLLARDTYVKRGAIYEDPFSFDASFFGYSVKDAEIMDPQQRQFLECAWEALEYSGNVPEKFKGDIAVFATQGRNDYFMNHLYASPIAQTNWFQAILGNEKDFLSTKASYKLNLTGPSITLQTACSSSLVAVQMACESLKTRSSDMALAGGVSLFYNHGYEYQEDMIESPDGYCRAFDARAKGTVVTSGVGIVVLKRLSDAIEQKDTIYAVIKGGAINNDGSSKMAFTAPSVDGQSAVIEKALKNANCSPDNISYIEAHGTGTQLGDPIEWTALHNVYQKYTDQEGRCTIGSVKTNIGHTDSAAGVFGLMKTVFALKHKVLPATLNFETLIN